MNQLGAAVGAGPAPTNAWWPAALVSWWLPGIGLLLLKDKDRKKLAIGSFVGYIAIVVVTSILIGVFASMEVPALPMILSLVLRLVQLVAHFGMLIYTHDETVRAYPHLGSPIFFKNAVNLPANLQ